MLSLSNVCFGEVCSVNKHICELHHLTLLMPSCFGVCVCVFCLWVCFGGVGGGGGFFWWFLLLLLLLFVLFCYVLLLLFLFLTIILVHNEGNTSFEIFTAGTRCSSVVRAFAHGAMDRQIDPSWWNN